MDNKPDLSIEPIRLRMITAGIVTVLCFTGIGVRVALQKSTRASNDTVIRSDETQGESNQHLSVRRFLTILNFHSLSDSSHKTLKLILLIPAGILVTTVYRRLTGFRTIGTFSPTLLALSQTKSDWRIGLPIFLTIFAVGTFFRMIFAPLQLPAFSRRGAVTVFVVLFLTTAMSLCEILNIGIDPRAVLLPVVVTTMMIERFFIILGKDGRKAAGYAFLNSVIVAICCFGLFAYTAIGPMLLAYPELELLILAGLILIGCYAGPTLAGRLGFGKDATGETDD